MPSTYERAKRELKDQTHLDRLYDTSMQHFGFFTTRYPRVYEYSWILDELEGVGLACDVGAGTSPLPIILAEDGWIVQTVDYWSEKTSDEWGFMNYNEIHENITSVNCDFANYEGMVFDVIYSVSAIEHMPAATRREVFKNAADHVDGMFLATIDVVRGTDQILNRNYGERIEDNHGTTGEVIAELERHFGAVMWWYLRGIKGVGTDLLFIKAVK